MDSEALDARRLRRPGLRTASSSPHWTGSIRFRITLVYSAMLFGLASIMVGAIYFGLARELSDDGLMSSASAGSSIEVGSGLSMNAAVFERGVNERTLAALRNYSLLGLASLFFGSLAVGWYVAGRVLAPIERITEVAREITATDLSRRINMTGPDDELRQLADTFDGMTDRLEESFAAQRRFIQEASHELRNPLAVIRTNLDVTLDAPSIAEEDFRATGEVVRRNAIRMTALVDDLLDYARMEVPSETSVLVDLVLLVEEVAEEFGAPASARGLEITHSVPDELLVMGDPMALRRAVSNLVTNAVRLAPSGTTISVSAAAESGVAELSVADEGPGIAVSDKERVFERFWRGETAGGEGRGLGLAIVRRIVAVHGGAIEVESELGVGSTFTIWLPLAQDDEPASQRDGSQAEHPGILT